MKKDVLENIKITKDTNLSYIKEYLDYTKRVPSMRNLNNYCGYVKFFYKAYLKSIKKFGKHDYSFEDYLKSINGQ